MAYPIAAQTVVAENPAYETVEAGEYALKDFVPCRRVVDENGPICAFLAATVLGVELQGEQE
jgi:hypothetical protein